MKHQRFVRINRRAIASSEAYITKAALRETESAIFLVLDLSQMY